MVQQHLTLIEKIVDEVEKVTMASQWAPTARRSLRESKTYLKTDYRLHYKETESTCPDHCRKFALSDPNGNLFLERCTHKHHVTYL